MAGAALLACFVVLAGPASADNDQKFVITGPATVDEGETATYKVTLTEGTDDDGTVQFNAAPSGTTSASDYSITPGTLTVPEGSGGATFTVQANEDSANEPNEPFTVTISNPVRGTIETAAVTTTINDDDPTPAIAISGPAPIAEGNTNASYTVSLSAPSASTVTVHYATANGSATAGATADYAATSGDLSWAPGNTADKSIVVPIREDTLDEIDETFTVTLSSPSGATISTATATTTITDDDDEVAVGTVSDVTVTEGNTGTVDASVTVTLSAASGKTVTVPYATAPGTATEGTDYEAKSGSYVFAPGDTSETVVFKVKGDTLFENDEKFSVVLTDPTNGAPGTDMRGEVTITDDDSTPIPTLTNPSVVEGNSGLINLVFEASLAAPHPAVTFNFRTVAETADTSDFEAQSGSKTFPANSGTTATKVPITIKVKGDLLDELDETMKLELLNNNDAVVRSATGTIKNDDDNSKLSISDSTADEPGTMKFTVTLAPASGRPVKVNWASADGTAVAPGDYTGGGGELTFAPGEVTKTIELAVAGDAVNEPNETLKVTLSGPSCAGLLDEEGVGTIVDKNAPPSLSIGDTSTREGTGATFTVTLAGTTLQTVTVRFNTADGTAKAGSDYSARTGSLSFAPGEKTKTITVTVLDDADSEPVEEFAVVIQDPTPAGVAITKARGDGSIEASDRSLDPPSNTPPTGTPQNQPNTPRTQLVPRMILGPRTVTVGVNGLARMQVNCQRISPIVCAGTVELERAAKPLLKLGKKTFSVKKGTKAYASVKLTPRALTALRKGKTMRVKVIVLVKTSTKTMKVSPGIITLKATKALLKAKPKSTAPTPPRVIVDP